MSYMHRKHKSTKVPNVRLRPRPSTSSTHREDAQDDFDSYELRHARELANDGKTEDQADEEDKEGPLFGYSFCFTGLSEEKLNLAAMVIQMTANLDGNFDETATHLVATSIGSQKYYAALQIGIPIVTPDFIYEARQRWIEDKAINPKELLHLHSLRPFQTLRIGICGVTKPEKRQALRAKVEELGGTVAMPMTFDSGVTHLLCGTTDIKNSATLSSLYQIKAGRAGTKEERRGAEMIKCVRPCWIEDCEKVGAAIHEEAYDIRKGITFAVRAEIVASYPDRSESALHKRCLETAHVNAEARRQVSRAKEEAKRRALAPKRDDLLAKSLRGMGASSTKAEKDKDIDTQVTTATDWSTTQSVESGHLLGMPRQVVAESACSPASKQALARADSATTSRPTFKDTRFRLALGKVDFGKQILIKNALVGAGAVMAGEGEEAAFTIFSNNANPSVSSLSGSHRTLFWVEACLHFERILQVSSSTLYFKPPTATLPVQGAADCIVALTGFPVDDSKPDRLQIGKALEIAGCSVKPDFRRKTTTHLLSARYDAIKSLSAEELEKRCLTKEAKAKQWDIPIVGVDFLARIWQKGEISPAASVRPKPLPSHLQNDESLQSFGETQESPDLGHNRSDAKITDPPRTVSKQASPGKDITNCEDREAKQPKVESKKVSLPADLPDSQRPIPTADEAHDVGSRRIFVPETMAGQSTWVMRVGDDISALVAAQGRDVSPPYYPQRATPSDTTSRRKAKPGPKSRRITSGVADEIIASSSTSRRSASLGRNSTSPTKIVLGEEDAADILLAQRQAEALRSAGEGLETIGTIPSRLDESIRISYRDPQSEKERRKLQELLAGEGGSAGGKKRGRAGDDSTAEEDGVGDSPGKPRVQARKQPGTRR